MANQLGGQSLAVAAASSSAPDAVERSAAQRLVPRAEFRKEIQGLRAVAVVAVVVFHLRPWLLPGGFVGVDVFFVISGYLISDLLLREIEATGRVSIAGFYARRVKRLLPIATAVILVVGACVGFLPVSRWRDTAGDMVASALYYQNWVLIARAKHYFAPVGDLSPLRHYWSLSVEEQYCILWPLPLLVGGFFGAFRHAPRRSLGIVAAAVALASLAWSIDLTMSAPRSAYFSTAARIWEFAIGALLASFQGWKRFGAPVRNALVVVGLALIAAASFFFDESIHFPGYAALVPTTGAALVLMSGGATSRWSPRRILEIAPAQYVGDLSYSLYLWHWPVFVLARTIGSDGGRWEFVLVCLGAIALADLSKRWIEDPFRRPSFAARHALQPFLLAACSILLVGLATASVRTRANLQSSPAGYREWIGSSDYPGARVLIEHLPPSEARLPYVPFPIDGFEDRPNDRPPDRWRSEKSDSPLALCQCGDPASQTQLVVIGDSHAEHWFPALAEIAERRRWRLAAITRSCAFADVRTVHDGIPDTMCPEWNRRAMERLKELKPKVVLIGQSGGYRLPGTNSREEDARQLALGYEKRWKELQERGTKIVAFRDTPDMNTDVPDCLSSFRGSIESCSNARQRALRRFDPILMAAARTPGVSVIEMTDAICGPETCAPVVGNLLVWRDPHHLTASYSRTIAPALEEVLAPFVEGAG